MRQAKLRKIKNTQLFSTLNMQHANTRDMQTLKLYQSYSYPFLRKYLPFPDSIGFLALAILKLEPLGLAVNDDVVLSAEKISRLQAPAVFP